MGMINGLTSNQQSHKTLVCSTKQTVAKSVAHLFTIFVPALKDGPPV